LATNHANAIKISIKPLRSLFVTSFYQMSGGDWILFPAFFCFDTQVNCRNHERIFSHVHFHELSRSHVKFMEGIVGIDSHTIPSSDQFFASFTNSSKSLSKPLKARICCANSSTSSANSTLFTYCSGVAHPNCLMLSASLKFGSTVQLMTNAMLNFPVSNSISFPPFLRDNAFLRISSNSDGEMARMVNLRIFPFSSLNRSDTTTSFVIPATGLAFKNCCNLLILSLLLVMPG